MTPEPVHSVSSGGVLRGSFEEGGGRGAAGRQDAPQRDSEFVHINLAFAERSQHRTDHKQEREEGENRGKGAGFSDRKCVVLEGTPDSQPQQPQESQSHRL
jgi:hypothetical protein